MNSVPDRERVKALRFIRGILSHSVGTVGRLMTPELIEVTEDWTMLQVLAHMRRVGSDSEALNAVHVTDDKGHLIDDSRMREILLAQPDSSVVNLMNREFVALKANDTEATAVDYFRRYDRTVLPVIDARNLLVGVVTVDVLDVAEETSTRDSAVRWAGSA